VLGLVLALATPAAAGIRVTFSPPTLRPGDVGLVIVQGVDDGATLEGSVAGHPLEFFPYARLTAALAAVDFETRPGRYPWRIAVLDGPGEPRALSGRLVVSPRRFPVERLTLPPAMVDLDAETTRRADAEQAQLRTVFGTVTRERLWRGRFTPPIAAAGAGHGFGARRVINGRSRAAHAGLDYAAARGTPVVATNAGRVALVADFFFPGRLVVIDHGFGLHTAYFHLDQVTVAEQDLVEQGQPIGAVGATGRATGPHLHFTAGVGAARIDPAALFRLAPQD